jgi:hypothetical protein
MPSHLPTAKDIRDLFTDLLGRDATLAPAPPFAPGPKNPASIAVYVDDYLRITALIACDLPLSAYAGAAIGLVPVGGADAAVEDGLLPDTLRDNLYEVLNVAASLFNAPGADHLRLHELYPAGPALPPQLQAQALTLGRREDVELDIAGYGAGRLSVVLVA